ncbi:UDP-N-acetylmuramoyl-tripeptide--D-alanyl-D-alanine ligase [Gemmiger sp. An50]|uniref:UDP-N-acetylmuramoyl-tripeptide--D-alanyl-D- alanine ligase n=1 Tax=Gemmiger sp. An50 TaxID=1965639 RepID=UPI000B37F5AE|nr:UDP-N-acetylmuramoyl-tripeptide--D-alanyl-D-alanine ligase [Gemmiger sp. An50]OUN87853.1 UDP-N-acetylmuramoyl-tripeptide--D-alanyl-D-alanine ligase [Gemmiger sp. An50]
MQPIPAKMLLAGLAEAGSVGSETITAVVTDSRAVCPGCVFVCFPGQRVDGHDFAAKAVEEGAAYVVANHPVEGVPEKKLVLCPSSHHAMVRMAANYRMLFHPKMIGVTGSVGKTTTKEFCYAILSAFGQAIKTEGNQNNEIGVPNTLFRITEETEYAVVEMGMSALGEIERLSRAARPDAGLITCIGVSHLESLGSRENILKAKLEICTGLPDGAPLALNADDEYLQLARREGMLPARLRPVWYGMNDPEADVRAVEVKPLENGMAFTLEDKEHGRFAVTIPALGMHSVYDALAAYAAATRMGLDAARCAAALADYQTTGMRQKVVENGGRVFIEDCYNASPDSMRASLNMFREYPCKGRRFALLGDMLELGSIEEEAHRQVGRWAAESGLAHLVTLGAASRFAADEAEKAGLAVTRCQTHEEAAQVLAGLMVPGDALLAKGSRGMRLEQVLQLLYTGETQTNN